MRKTQFQLFRNEKISFFQITVNIILKSSICLIAFSVSGCAGTAQYLRSQPSTYYKQPPNELVLSDKELSPLFKVKCMMGHPSDLMVASEKQSLQCLYISIDAAEVATDAALSRSVRDKAIAYLISISDSNCSNFLDRAFANKAGLDLSKSLASDLATGVSAITAFNTPMVSASLSLTNLIVGKTVDNINNAYYFDKTFQAFEAAVTTERARLKSEIISRQANRPVVSTDFSAVQYGLFEVMADIRTYDDACSMRTGLAKLVETASALKIEQIKQSAKADTEAKTESLNKAKDEFPAKVTTTAPNPSAAASNAKIN